MNCTLVVHQDDEPFVGLQRFTNREALQLVISQTHNALLDDGYSFVTKEERNQQKVTTYIDTHPESGKRTVYVTVIHE